MAKHKIAHLGKGKKKHGKKHSAKGKGHGKKHTMVKA